MVQAPAAATCVNHRRKSKVASCGTCGNALCADCVVHTPVGVKCRSCTGVKGSGFGSGAHISAGASREPAGDARVRRPWAVALLGVGVLVVAIVGYSLATRGSDPAPDQPVVALSPVASQRTTEFVGAGGLRLGGTLTIPPAAPGQTRVPAVLIVAGLGAVDRDSVSAAGTPDATRDAIASTMTVSALGGTEPMFKDLSQALANAGIASFRYDKRGTAASKLKPEQKFSFEDEVADARAALDFLSQRQEVGDAPIAVLGHDQGGLVAMRAAAGNPRVKALVTVSTPGRPLADVLADDLTRARGAVAGDELRAAVATLKSTTRVPAPDSLSVLLRPLFPAGQESYLLSVLTNDPVAEARAVTVPALVVRGGGDQSTSMVEVGTLLAAMRTGGEILVGAPDTDRNLAHVMVGHEHTNTVGAPVSNQDAQAAGRIASWLQTKLRT